MKKVIFQIITHLEVGGAERIAFNLAKSKSDGFEYHVVEVARGNSSYTKEMIHELESNQIFYHRSSVRNNKIAILTFPFRLKKLIKEYNPSIIQTHTEVPDLAVFLFSKLYPRTKINVVRTLHNTLLWQNWEGIGKKVEKWMIEKKANVSNSKAVSESYKNNYGKDVDLPLIYNGFKSANPAAFQGLNHRKINVLFAGRFVPQKGIDTLIEVVKAANKDIYDFTIAGVGPLEEQVRTGLASCSNVKIIEPIANLSCYLNSFDFVLITSIHEGLNSLSIEASFSGTPVIINDIDGLNETVPEDWPLKVSQNSLSEYKVLFDSLPGLDYEGLKQKASDFVNKRFSIATMQKEYESLYAKKIQ